MFLICSMIGKGMCKGSRAFVVIWRKKYLAIGCGYIAKVEV
jgi:hypothetical protein